MDIVADHHHALVSTAIFDERESSVGRRKVDIARLSCQPREQWNSGQIMVRTLCWAHRRARQPGTLLEAYDPLLPQAGREQPEGLRRFGLGTFARKYGKSPLAGCCCEVCRQRALADSGLALKEGDLSTEYCRSIEQSAQLGALLVPAEQPALLPHRASMPGATSACRADAKGRSTLDRDNGRARSPGALLSRRARASRRVARGRPPGAVWCRPSPAAPGFPGSQAPSTAVWARHAGRGTTGFPVSVRIGDSERRETTLTCEER